MFGGYDGNYLSDVWSLDDLSQTVTAAPPRTETSLVLHPGRPSPFNPRTQLVFELPRAMHASLTIHDATGRRVRILLEEYRPAGSNTAGWDGLDQTGRPVGSGAYYARLVAGAESAVQKLVLVK